MRVVRYDELARMAGLMQRHESVQMGGELEWSARAWKKRMVGSHRFTLLLEHQKTPLAYMLVSVSPDAPAAKMDEIFDDAWPRGGEQVLRATCNFYSINAVNKDPSNAFFNVPVGFPCIKKSAEFLGRYGVRHALAMRDIPNEKLSELNSVSDDPSAVKFFTMSPIPSLSRHMHSTVTITNPYEMVAQRSRILAKAKEIIAAKQDPVARFHMGNGASLHRLNWMADSSSSLRMEQSYGLMCNYKY